jgi:hypothetical protein
VASCPNTAQATAVTLRELATNAAKYRALSAAKGKIDLTWLHEADGSLIIRWTEMGGPAVQTPTRQGFGGRVIKKMINQIEGKARFDIPRAQRPDTELEAKEVRVGDRRYIVCRNLNEAKRDANVREAVLRSLRVALRGGDKSLVGNSAYRRYLKTPDEQHFEIDEKRVAEDAQCDGLYVLRTNTTLSPLAVMLRYRELLKVEEIFRTTKSILDTRPIYH